MKKILCEYCKNDGYETPNKSIISASLKKNQVDVDLSLNVKRKSLCLWADNLKLYGDDTWFETSDQYTLKKINYCPMCGRKLMDKEVN